MIRIVLIRHVTPQVSNEKCNWKKAQDYLIEYNETINLHLEETALFQQSDEYRHLLSINKIFVSPLVRAKQTAIKLFGNRIFIQLDELKEFNLNIAKIPYLKLSVQHWFIFSRVLWFLGLNKSERNFIQEKNRVKKLMPFLLSQECIIVSHGFVISEIKKNLNKLGFEPITKYKNGCFSVEIFNK